MYRNLYQHSSTGRSLGKTEGRLVTRYRKPVGLSLDLTQTLQQSLYPGLNQHVRRIQLPSTHFVSVPIQVQLPSTIANLEPPVSNFFVRNVCMLPGEFVSHTFSPVNGLISEPLSQGRMLVLTNRRIIVFSQKAGIRETVLVPLEEVKTVAVNDGKRNKGTLFQGGLMIVASVLFYVLFAYWITGYIDGPQVPVVRMDLGAFVVFLIVLIAVAMFARIYFGKPDGEVTFQGDGVKFTFPFREDTSQDQIYVLVNAAFAARQKILG